MNNFLTGGGSLSDESGDPLPHQPVLYHEVLDALAPKSGKDYLDGTLGAGGHAEGIITTSSPQGRLLGLDLDPEALAFVRQRLFAFRERVIIRQASFQQASEILREIGWDQVSGILLDLGVSSMQIDQPNRGFSFLKEGPLDMRFNPSHGLRADDLVNNLNEAELTKIISQFGEDRYSRRIARAIVASRPIHTTRSLAEIIKEAVPGQPPQSIHPATRTFQALRIVTNQELETISSALPDLVACLAPGGKLAVISFHSLEDRIVKQFFKRESTDCLCPPELPVCNCDHNASLKILTKKPIRPSEQEININPRSRSARMRVAEKKH